MVFAETLTTNPLYLILYRIAQSRMTPLRMLRWNRRTSLPQGKQFSSWPFIKYLSAMRKFR